MKAHIVGSLSLVFALICFVNAKTQAHAHNLCQHVVCPAGRVCAIGEDGNSTVCECPAECTSEHAPVCSVFYTDHVNPCEMHKVACIYGFLTAVKHKSKCSKNGADFVERQCPIERLLDFHSRYLEWLFVAYKHSKPGQLKKHIRINSVLDEERETIIMWEFNNVDANKNETLDEHEVKTMIDEREVCMAGFLDACDFDGQPGISRKEWHACFPPRLEGLNEAMEA